MSNEVGPRTVTVGVDGSGCALRAVRWGAAEVARRGERLRLVSAFGWRPERRPDHPGFRLDYREMLRGRAEAQLVVARAAAEAAVPGIEVDAEAVEGSPYAVLADEARRAQLLALGSRGRGRLEGLLTGSVAVALAATAPCPVVVVRGAERAEGEDARLPVVVGVDGTASGEDAIAFAFEAAATRAAELVAVHAWRAVTVPFGYDPLRDQPSIGDAELRALDERLAEHLGAWTQKHPEVPVRRVLAAGRAAPALLEQADQAQLVVVGSRGRGELTGLVLGSVGNVLVHRASCPVAVVRGSR